MGEKGEGEGDVWMIDTPKYSIKTNMIPYISMTQCPQVEPLLLGYWKGEVQLLSMPKGYRYTCTTRC